MFSSRHLPTYTCYFHHNSMYYLVLIALGTGSLHFFFPAALDINATRLIMLKPRPCSRLTIYHCLFSTVMERVGGSANWPRPKRVCGREVAASPLLLTGVGSQQAPSSPSPARGMAGTSDSVHSRHDSAGCRL